MEDYKANIIATRKGGFGSSDARLIAAIGRSGINYQAQIRIAQMLGLAERENYTNSAMRFGDNVEMEVYQSLKAENGNALSNPYVESAELSEKYGFKIFTHIDVEIETPESIVWYECKAINCKGRTLEDTLNDTINEYHDQLRWHFKIGTEKAERLHKMFTLYLVLYGWYDGEEDAEFNFDPSRLIYSRPLTLGHEGYFHEIEQGLCKISMELPTFTWKPKIELTGQDLLPEVSSKINAIAETYKRIEEEKAQLEKMKQLVFSVMQTNNIKSIKLGGVTFSYRSGYKTTRFDSKSFKADHPELVSKYETESTVEPTVTIKADKE